MAKHGKVWVRDVDAGKIKVEEVKKVFKPSVAHRAVILCPKCGGRNVKQAYSGFYSLNCAICGEISMVTVE